MIFAFGMMVLISTTFQCFAIAQLAQTKRQTLWLGLGTVLTLALLLSILTAIGQDTSQIQICREVGGHD